MTIDVAALADELDRSYTYLWHKLSLLEPEEIEEACLQDGWSPKVLLAHVAFWDDFQTRRMQAALAGTWQESVPNLSDDNDGRARLDAGRDWQEVAAEADRNRQRMIDFARSLTPEQVEAVYREGGKDRQVILHLLNHMPRHAYEHAAEIERYCGSLKRWGRAGLRHCLFTQHENFLDSIGCLSEETVTTVPVCGVWSVRDLVAHVTAWDAYTLQVVHHWPDTEHTSLARWREEPDEDKLNARFHAESAHLDMIEVLDAAATIHRRLLTGFDRLSDADLECEGDFGLGMQGTLSSFFYGMATHKAEHAAQIWEARIQGVLAPVEV
jgi:hypothetical protein